MILPTHGEASPVCCPFEAEAEGAAHTTSSPERLIREPGGLLLYLQYVASALAVPLAAVIIGVGIYYSVVFSVPQSRLQFQPDKEKCSCSCWDGLFKGHHMLGSSFERPDGTRVTTAYKSLYFNMDITMLFILVVYSITYYVITAVVSQLARVVLWDLASLSPLSALPCMQGHGRGIQKGLGMHTNVPAALMLCFSIYSIIYGAWSLINYLNDRFMLMAPSQTFFLLTECVSVAFLLRILDRHTLRGWHRADMLAGMAGLAVSVAHICLALSESLLSGVIERLTGHGAGSRQALPSHINARDILLLSSDVGCVALVLHMLATKHGAGTLLGVWRNEQLACRLCAGAAVTLVVLYEVRCSFKL